MIPRATGSTVEAASATAASVASKLQQLLNARALHPGSQHDLQQVTAVECSTLGILGL